jgi:hypothetical protein
MKALWLCAAFLLFAVIPLRAETEKIASPDIARMHADGTAIEHSLFWNDKQQTLYAYVRFSNSLYVNSDEPLAEESFVFRLPGIKFDPATRTYYVEPAPGDRIKVATQNNSFLNHSIAPVDGVMFTILKHGGEATVSMDVDTGREPCDLCSRWSEHATGVSLEHLLHSLAGQP